MMIADENCRTMKIRLTDRALPLMYLVLARGVCFQTPPGLPVAGFLADVLPVSPDYIAGKVQTILMNGHALDDPEAVLIDEPCTLALSAAMPGLFGAAFRRNGRFSRLRRSYTGGAAGEKTASGRMVKVRVKLFNQVAGDLGKDLLARGVCLDIEVLADFWQRQWPLLESGCRDIRIDDTTADPERVAEILRQQAGTGVLQATSR